MVRGPDGEQRVAPPAQANPFYAAATTAGARAMLLDATSKDPDAVIMFATDGICTLRELPDLVCPAETQLGTWEQALREDGVFVKAGIYSHRPFTGEAKQGSVRSTKMRGIRPTNLPDGMTAEQWLIKSVPAAWAADLDALEFPYRAYKTVGAAVASPEAWKLAGHWIEGQRVANIQEVSLKRDSRGVARTVDKDGKVGRGQRKRAHALFDTLPAENPEGWTLSHERSPEWLNEALGRSVRAEEEQKVLEHKSGFGKDPDSSE